jgi:hypothetical protein
VRYSYPEKISMKFKRYEISVTWTFDVPEFTDMQPLIKRIVDVFNPDRIKLRREDRPLFEVKEVPDAESEAPAQDAPRSAGYDARMDRGDKGTPSDSAKGGGQYG